MIAPFNKHQTPWFPKPPAFSDDSTSRGIACSRPASQLQRIWKTQRFARSAVKRVSVRMGSGSVRSVRRPETKIGDTELIWFDIWILKSSTSKETWWTSCSWWKPEKNWLESDIFQSLRGSLPKRVPLDFGLEKTFALYSYHQHYYPS